MRMGLQGTRARMFTAIHNSRHGLTLPSPPRPPPSGHVTSCHSAAAAAAADAAAVPDSAILLFTKLNIYGETTVAYTYRQGKGQTHTGE